MRDIARMLERSPNTISYELCENETNGSYDPKKAHHKAYVRRKYARFQVKKIVASPKIQSFIEEKLYAGNSPRAIAGRLKKRIDGLPYVSKDCIYRFIKSVYGRKIEAYRSMRRRKHRRKRPRKSKLTDRTFIAQRPQIINRRSRVGDTEADFIVSGKNGKGVLLVVVCRKLRVVFIERIVHVTIPNVHRAFRRIQKRFPEMRTITTDNDLLLQKHKQLEELLGVKIYFCDPYSSWQKGTVENANKHIRKDIPKGSDISKYSHYRVRKIEATLNNRIMECLDFATPAELLAQHRQRKKHRSASRESRKSKK
jgi:transposase, IS30 family